MIQVLLAILAGILTIGAPCILPLLPILLGASIGQQNKLRPLFIALGFIVMFSITGLTLSLIVTRLMIAPDILRNWAIFFLAIFGLLMIWPKPFEILTLKLSGVINQASQTAAKAGSGNLGGFILGLILGLIWTPCAGPVLGSILTLIATQTELKQAGILLIAYAIGAGLPMLLIAYGGQIISSKIKYISNYTKGIQQFFGVIILLLAVAMFYQYDTLLQAKLLEKFNFTSLESKIIKPLEKSIMLEPGKVDLDETNIRQPPMPEKKGGDASQPQVPDLPDYGPAPEITGIENWLNSNALSLKELKGKVVLIDFWTYSCINCIRTLPYLAKWYADYQDKGLVIIGVHTPEFAFEQVKANVQKAIGRFNIKYPVAQDNAYQTWTAFNNHYWPAKYLIDKTGNIRYAHFGEGKYEETEDAIRTLLGLSAQGDLDQEANKDVRTPEIYLGTSRIQNLSGEQVASMGGGLEYKLPNTLALNQFALGGYWEFFPEKIQSLAPGKIRLKYYASNIFMVARADKPITIGVRLDGDKAADVQVEDSRLYELIKSDVPGEHILELEIPEGGFEIFTFTFG